MEQVDPVQAATGVFYIAFGDAYQGEARASIASLRRVNPGLRIAVVTDREWQEEPRPDVFIIRPAIEGFSCKPRYIEDTPFAATLFVDTDTMFARDPEGIFGLLRHYDIGVSFVGPKLNEPDGLEFHTQCSSGVIVFSKNERVASVFENWRHHFDEARARTPASDRRGLNDQRYLALAIARSQARPVHLDAFLQFVLFTVSVTYSPPVIYHGRGRDLPTVDSLVTKDWDPRKDWHARLWLPNIRGLLPMGIRRSDPVLALALLLRRCWNELRWRLAGKRERDEK